jgi:hypothetical protein
VLTAHVCEEGHARGLPILHVPTLGHTYTHMLGTHACMFTTLDNAPVVYIWRNPRPRGFGDLPLYLSPYEASPMDLLLYLGLFRTYIHGKQRLGPLYHGIGSGRPVVRVSTYRSWISPSVNNPCLWRRPCPGPTYIAYTNIGSHLYTYVRDTCMQSF